MGAKYVCYQDNAGDWFVLDDACSHRLAPCKSKALLCDDECLSRLSLTVNMITYFMCWICVCVCVCVYWGVFATVSEGRIERETNTIECAYHGWQFDSSGKCQRIPQLEDEPFRKVVESPLSCVASYPVMVEKGLLWSWLWSDDQLSVAGVPEAHPEVIAKGVNGPKYMRDLPYGWDTLMENLLDPAHVPFAHHGLQGTRDDAIPINMTVPSDVTEYGFRMEFEDRTMKNLRKGFGELRAPYMLHYEGHYYDEDGNRKEDAPPFRLSTVCTPIRPGWSRIIVVPGGFGGENDGNEIEGKRKLSFVSKIFKTIPPWIVHILNSRFLDSDLAFLDRKSVV